ncbi:MAG: histidine phosphatase family protein [Lachnospiraceae bacterium]|nr:histidine phosphatase family protein [Lachnospiraceae bacterium]
MLYIMRHGRTDWNDLRKLQGRTDIPLNEEGRAQAKAAAEEIRDLHLDICFVSPLQRATETAQILLAGRDIPIVQDDRLKEMCFGIYEGVENSFQIPDCPVNQLFQAPEEYKVPVEGGESLEELYARTGAFLKEQVYPLTEQGKDVLIVGHGAMNCSIICQVRNIPVKDFWSAGIDNCKVIRLT